MWDNFVLLDGTAQNVNNFIRQHIQNNNLQQSEALFPINQWNVVNRLQNQISRTNNSIEAFFNIFSTYLHPKPPLSAFMKQVTKENVRWITESCDGIRIKA